MPCATANTKPTRLTPFEVLGVSAADDYATIRKAWKRLVKANHPDRCPADAARLTKRLQQINDAFEKLRNHVPVKGAAKATQTRDFAAEAKAEREKARKHAQAQKEAQAQAAARAKAQAKAAAEARAARQAEQAAQARKNAQEHARKRAQAPRFSDAQRAALRTATRAFTDARTAFAKSARHGYASAA